MNRFLTTVLVLAGAAPLQATQLKTATWSRQVTDEQRIEVDVGYGAGELTLRPGESGLLYRARFDYDETFMVPTAEYEGGRLEIGLESAKQRRFGFGRSTDSSLDLWLAGDVPMDLSLDFGAGTADLDLSGLRLRSLEVNTGASESEIRVGEVNPERMRSATVNVGAAELTFVGIGNLNAERIEIKAGLGSVTLGLDGEWPADAQISVGMGLGSLRIRIPAALGVEVRRDNVLAAVDMDGFVRSGSDYRSRNWETAARRVRLDISAALGSIDIDWIR